MPSIKLSDIIKFLSGLNVSPENHTVLLDGEPKGDCTRASFRSVVSLSGLEFPVDYAYKFEDKETTLSARLRSQGLGKGGREQIKVNGAGVKGDDVLVGFELDGITPIAYVEFRYLDGDTERSVKFLAPLPNAV